MKLKLAPKDLLTISLLPVGRVSRKSLAEHVPLVSLTSSQAPIHTFLDFSFLKTLPVAQVRNGFAELIKISSCADLSTFELLHAHCEELISSKFGRATNSRSELKDVADRICDDSIYEMLRLETPNLHEIMLDRVIAFGHT